MPKLVLALDILAEVDNMKKILIYLLIAIGIFGLTSLASCEHRHHKYHKAKVKVYHTQDGRYCYHDDNWVWYYLMLNSSSGSSNNTYYTAPAIGERASFAGNWVKSNEKPNEQEIKEIQDPNGKVEQEETEITEDAAGNPVDESAIDANDIATVDEAFSESNDSFDSGSDAGDSGGSDSGGDSGGSDSGGD